MRVATEFELQCAWVVASGSFLTGHLPDDWKEMSEDHLMAYVSNHTWEPFEYTPPESVWEHIDVLAEVIEQDRKNVLENAELRNRLTAYQDQLAAEEGGSS